MKRQGVELERDSKKICKEISFKVDLVKDGPWLQWYFNVYLKKDLKDPLALSALKRHLEETESRFNLQTSKKEYKNEEILDSIIKQDRAYVFSLYEKHCEEKIICPTFFIKLCENFSQQVFIYAYTQAAYYQKCKFDGIFDVCMEKEFYEPLFFLLDTKENLVPYVTTTVKTLRKTFKDVKKHTKSVKRRFELWMKVNIYVCGNTIQLSNPEQDMAILLKYLEEGNVDKSLVVEYIEKSIGLSNVLRSLSVDQVYNLFVNPGIFSFYNSNKNTALFISHASLRLRDDMIVDPFDIISEVIDKSNIKDNFFYQNLLLEIARKMCNADFEKDEMHGFSNFTRLCLYFIDKKIVDFKASNYISFRGIIQLNLSEIDRFYLINNIVPIEEREEFIFQTLLEFIIVCKHMYTKSIWGFRSSDYHEKVVYQAKFFNHLIQHDSFNFSHNNYQIIHEMNDFIRGSCGLLKRIRPEFLKKLNNDNGLLNNLDINKFPSIVEHSVYNTATNIIRIFYKYNDSIVKILSSVDDFPNLEESIKYPDTFSLIRSHENSQLFDKKLSYTKYMYLNSIFSKFDDEKGNFSDLSKSVFSLLKEDLLTF